LIDLGQFEATRRIVGYPFMDTDATAASFCMRPFERRGRGGFIEITHTTEHSMVPAKSRLARAWVTLAIGATRFGDRVEEVWGALADWEGSRRSLC
jgi:hypothetical protein